MKERLENPMLLVIDMQNVYGKGQAWECKRFAEHSHIVGSCDQGRGTIYKVYGSCAAGWSLEGL